MPPRLSETLLSSFTSAQNIVAQMDAECLLRPERILQFGTGGFLRGFVDWFVDKANRTGFYDGRIVAVQSTGKSRNQAFEAQDGLFTVCEQGLVGGSPLTQYTLVGSVSRTLTAAADWTAVLEAAENPDLEVVVSNTTEVGIRYEADDIHAAPPSTFPGKLTAVLHRRYSRFNGAAEAGLIVIPCELIPENGATLKEAVLRHSADHDLGAEFETWVESANVFCNTLVDRIVPGYPESPQEAEAHFDALGYSDTLLTCAEHYRLWAIQGLDPDSSSLPGFLRSDPGIVLTDDLQPFHERKVRLLNGTHSASAPVMLLNGFQTVKESMDDAWASCFVADVMRKDILPCLKSDAAEAERFAGQVLERFANPFLRHFWKNIMLQATSKWKTRLLPVLAEHMSRSGAVPARLQTAFASYLELTEVRPIDGKWRGSKGSLEWELVDEYAPVLSRHWESNADRASAISSILSDARIWGMDLQAAYPAMAAKLLREASEAATA